MNSQEEILDVVDEQNRIVGQAPRSEIHALGLRHRAAHILIFNPLGELLLQQRSIEKDDFPGYWDASAAGHVDMGESYEACILREVQEELGVSLKEPPTPLCLIPASEENGMEFCQIYEANHAGPFTPDASEIIMIRWFDREAIREALDDQQMLITPTLIHLLQYKGWL